MKNKIVLASRNKKKVKEIEKILQALGIEDKLSILTLDNFPELAEVAEDSPTYKGNSEKKARYVADMTGLPAIADDSGIEIDLLNGMPGVRSARFAGENAGDKDNITKVITLLKEAGKNESPARFRTVICIALPGSQTYFAEGVCEGIVKTEITGDNGFGYDPIFYPEGKSQSFAQLEEEEKNKLSHRGKALENIKDILKKLI